VAKPIGICGFCLGDNLKNANGVPEKMINCAECGNSGHPSCLQYSEKLVKKIRTIRWQCIDCKRCIVCNKSDDSLLFCDFCDSGIHPKCCDPPLDEIPDDDFTCYLCRNEIPPSPKKTLVKTLSTSSTSSRRSRRSQHSNSDDAFAHAAELPDEMSNGFLSKKPQTNHIRQQSVQKAMKYLRDKKAIKTTNKKLLKRLHSPTLAIKSSKENTDIKNELLAKTILASSKSQRIRKEPSNDDLSSTPQTSTPLLTRQLSNRKLLPIDPITPPHRNSRRTDIPSVDESNKINSKRKHSTNSLSPISATSASTLKKRTRKDSPVRNHKRKDSQTEDDHSDADDLNGKHMKTNGYKQKINLNLSKYDNLPGFIHDSLPENVTEHDVYLFLESRANCTKLVTDCSEKFHHSSESLEDDATNTRWPPYIVLGSELLKTWYSSSYPQEYARVPRLYICEFCLKYMKCEQVYDRHRKKCTMFHPPANEIYHKDDLSVFEVDGNTSRIYCQNLCLLAKLFLDHKTLYYDVEPFLFYVLTRNDANGCHFIGYFSKEKHCPQKYNLSCITVLPICQRRGYGRFLIELSYLISQKEGQVGTPERPLSTLGAQTYEAYWKIKIVEQLLVYYNENSPKCLLKTIMSRTGMAIDDIVDTLQNLGILTMKSNGKPVISADVTQLETIMTKEKIKHAHWVKIDSEYLRFTPVLTPLLLANEEKAVEKEVKEIQIVFKEIGREAAEAASLAAEAADGCQTADGVRYIRRRKFGQKRRSIIVKRRTPMANKSNKNDSMITHNDSYSADIIANDVDEHSQEYKPRRSKMVASEPVIKEDDIEEEEGEEKDSATATVMQEETKTAPVESSPKPPAKQSAYKQLKLDQFIKIASVKETPVSVKASTDEKPESNNHVPYPETEAKTDSNDEVQSETRRITRNTRLHSTSKSEAEPVKLEENVATETSTKPDLNHENSVTRQISEGGVSTESSSDSLSIADAPRSSSAANNMDRPLPLKKRALASNKPNQPHLMRQLSTATTSTNPPETPSSLSDILANPFLSSPSISGTDDETKIARIESQLKEDTVDIINNNHVEKEEEEEPTSSLNRFETTIKPVEITEDQLPPRSTSPTSMIVSQSNHYNYSTKNKQQQLQQPHQAIPVNSFHGSTNMAYSFNNSAYPYPYPPVPPYSVPPYYYPPNAAMDYMSYYSASSSSSIYPPPGSIYGDTTEQQSYYTSNSMNSIAYNGNGTAPYIYPSAQSSAPAPTATQQH
ncbi:unnamed protein product, partial [Adineta ricciae]